MDNPALTFQPARPEQYDEYLELMRAEMGAYFESVLAVMQISWLEFAQLFRTVGKVFVIFWRGTSAGFYWAEERDRTLHLHGLLIREPFQGRGIGTAVLDGLADEYKDSMDNIELGVHVSNRRAMALYERLGYCLTQHRADVGFYIVRKPLQKPEASHEN